MPTTPGSSDPSRSPRAPKPVSDAEAHDVKGGATSATTPNSPTLKPVAKPVIPRLALPCI